MEDNGIKIPSLLSISIWNLLHIKFCWEFFQSKYRSVANRTEGNIYKWNVWLTIFYHRSIDPDEWSETFLSLSPDWWHTLLLHRCRLTLIENEGKSGKICTSCRSCTKNFLPRNDTLSETFRERKHLTFVWHWELFQHQMSPPWLTTQQSIGSNRSNQAMRKFRQYSS